MKEWTRQDALAGQLLAEAQFNAQHQSFRGQLSALDRTQTPVEALDDSGVLSRRVRDGALHKVWVFCPWDTGSALTAGEQVRYRAADADTDAEQWMAVTYQQYSSGWVTAFETTLTPFRGGSLLTEWQGNSLLQVFFTWTKQASQHSTPLPGRQADRYMGLRLLYNGAVAAERHGPTKPMDCFRIVGERQMPAGDVTLTCQFQLRAAGPDDAIEDVGSPADHLCQGHLWGNRVVSIGRWR